MDVAIDPIIILVHFGRKGKHPIRVFVQLCFPVRVSPTALRSQIFKKLSPRLLLSQAPIHIPTGSQEGSSAKNEKSSRQIPKAKQRNRRFERGFTNSVRERFVHLSLVGKCSTNALSRAKRGCARDGWEAFHVSDQARQMPGGEATWS
jgi:hypothetical protein